MKIAIRPGFLPLAGGFWMLAAAGSASPQSMDHLAEADSNGDGNIEWQEMLDMRAGIFERLDRNGDGFADSEDAPRIGPGRSHFNEALANLATADANGDGRITQTELLDSPAPVFEEGDTDGDGILLAEEITALREAADDQT